MQLILRNNAEIVGALQALEGVIQAFEANPINNQAAQQHLSREQVLRLLDNLPTKKLDYDDESASFICPICLEEFAEESSSNAKELPECGHYFHYNCIKEWLLINNCCPSCRREVEA